MSTPTFGFNTTAVEVAEHFKEEIKGRNVLITGVSPSSLGEETLKALVPYAKTIVVASRTPSKFQKVIDEVESGKGPHAKLISIQVDLSSLESVKKAATQVNDLKLPIDILINNAGMLSQEFKKNGDGYEYTFVANHLGHFLFTSRILPSLKAAQTADYKPRVINLSSVAHTMAPPRVDDWTYQKRPEEFEMFASYSSSKTANVLFSRGLAKRYGDWLLSYSLHPGNILETGGAAGIKDLLAKMGLLHEDGSKKDPSTWKSIPEGSSTTVFAALSPSIISHNGSYLVDCALADDQATEAAKDPANVDSLWEDSEKLIGEKFGQHA